LPLTSRKRAPILPAGSASVPSTVEMWAWSSSKSRASVSPESTRVERESV